MAAAEGSATRSFPLADLPSARKMQRRMHRCEAKFIGVAKCEMPLKTDRERDCVCVCVCMCVCEREREGN